MTRALKTMANDLSFTSSIRKEKHYSALKIKDILGANEFNRCFKFSVVRNPWSLAYSRYLFEHVDYEPSEKEKLRRQTTRRFHNLEFEDWLKARLKNERKICQLRGLVDSDGSLLMDHVGRLENPQATLDLICSRIGIDRIEMPHVNGARPGHYAQYYNKNTQQMVRELCQRDIEYFGYSFDSE